jgi:hypothetical protein
MKFNNYQKIITLNLQISINNYLRSKFDNPK